MLHDHQVLTEAFLGLLDDRQISFVIVGGIALLHYVPARNTDDLDLIISRADLEAIPEVDVQEQNSMFAYGLFYGLRVNVLFDDHPLFALVRQSFARPMMYQAGKFQHSSLLTATVDGLLLLKLFALPDLYRQFNTDRVAIYETDVLQLLSRSSQPDEFFLELLKPYVLEFDLVELGQILVDIRRKLHRLRKP